VLQGGGDASDRKNGRNAFEGDRHAAHANA
jgi:hypothetical protein